MGNLHPKAAIIQVALIHQFIGRPNRSPVEPPLLGAIGHLIPGQMCGKVAYHLGDVGEILEALERGVALKEALRRHILTDELLQLPVRLERIETDVSTLKENLTTLTNTVNRKWLILATNQLTGEIPPELGNLANLAVLGLDGNQLSGPIPAELGSLASLFSLNLSGNQLSGPIPAELGSLANLRHLVLSGNQLTGCIPHGLRIVKGLDGLSLEFCPDPGTTTATAPPLGDCATGGAVTDAATSPGLVADCTALLAARDTLAGTAALNWSADLAIDRWEGVSTTGTPPRVTSLNLYDQRLTGKIPEQLGSLTYLKNLRFLSYNLLSESIPAALGSLTYLKDLDLSDNRLSGPIPAELGSLVNLRYLVLYGNRLTGCIPAELEAVAVTDGSLPFCTSGSGDLLPDSPTGLTNVVSDTAPRVELSWTAPNFTGGAPITGYLVQSSTDGTEPWMEVITTTGNATSYTDEGADSNGPMFEVGTTRHYRVSAINSVGPGAPSDVAKAEDLVGRYDADDNGTIEKEEVIAAINDYLFGEGDEAISKGDVIKLINLYLFGPSTQHNRPGAPEGLTAAGNGQTLIDLSWTAPTDDGGADIIGYRIEVSIDGSSWSDLEANTRSTITSYSHSSLTAGSTRHYRVSAINSVGTGPASNVVTGTTDTGTTAGNTDTDLAALGALYNATDGANWGRNGNWLSNAPMGEWHGVTTDSDGRVTDLSLSFNQLTGEIPAELGGLTNLEGLALSFNRLTGEIPAELGGLANLTGLRLYNNQLTGEIPEELGNLSNLTILRISGNSLTGCIPAGLTEVATNDLASLNLPDCVPSIEVNPLQGQVGDTVTVAGSHFDKSTQVSAIAIGGTAALPSPAPTTAADGSFTVQVSVPQLDVGVHVLEVTVAGSTATTQFTVTP